MICLLMFAPEIAGSEGLYGSALTDNQSLLGTERSQPDPFMKWGHLFPELRLQLFFERLDKGPLLSQERFGLSVLLKWYVPPTLGQIR